MAKKKLFWFQSVEKLREKSAEKSRENKGEVYFRAIYDEDDSFRSGDLDMRQFMNNRMSLPRFM